MWGEGGVLIVDGGFYFFLKGEGGRGLLARDCVISWGYVEMAE